MLEQAIESLERPTAIVGKGLCGKSRFGDGFLMTWLQKMIRRHPTLTTLVLVLLVGTVATWALRNMTVPNPATSNRCLDNASSIFQGVMLHRAHSRGHAWPANLNVLRTEASPDALVFWCPGAPVPANPSTTPSDYFYLPPSSVCFSDTLILCELSDRHPRFGQAVCFADGRVRMLGKWELRAELDNPHNARFAAAYRLALNKYKPR